MILDIVTYPDPCLKQPCGSVAEVTDEIRHLAADMLETMYDVGGVGLAGPQVGISKQIFTFGGIDHREGYIINQSRSGAFWRGCDQRVGGLPVRTPELPRGRDPQEPRPAQGSEP